MNSVHIKQSPSTKISHGDRKHTLNDSHRASKLNNIKKQKKPKGNNGTTHEEQSIRIFRNMQEEVRNRLTCCAPGQELELLHHVLKPDNNELWLRCMEVKRDLLMAFHRTYPSVRLEVFGSTVMGIAFKDSDFDFFIELKIMNTKPASVIGKAMNILRQTGLFSNFLPISHARVPILKCHHIRTGYQCDINFSDSYGILNSPIVARLLAFDHRIYVLATILKYWTKVHDCSGKNRISNYAVVWMLLFYLQQLATPILPPICAFQQRVCPLYVNGYNFAYDERLPNRTTNQSRISELLLGFFNFYKAFDFESHIICPLYGKAFRKSDVLAKKVPEFTRYYEMLNFNTNISPMQFNKCICIQDPFEITYSISNNIAAFDFQKIMLKFEYAAAIVDYELKTNGESTKLLLLMFDAEKFNQNIQLKIQRSATAVFKRNSTTIHKSSLIIKATDYHLSIVREILMKKSSDINLKIDNQAINKTWCEYIIEFIEKILRDIFILKIDNDEVNNIRKELEGDFANAEKNTDNESGLNSSENAINRYILTGTRDCFLGRKQSKKITIQTLNAEMMESKERSKQSGTCEIQLKMYAKISADTKNYDAIHIDFYDLIKTKKNNSFKTFFTNFDQNLNHLLKICFVHKSGI